LLFAMRDIANSAALLAPAYTLRLPPLRLLTLPTRIFGFGANDDGR